MMSLPSNASSDDGKWSLVGCPEGPSAAPAGTSQMRIVAIEGIDGVGKSTCSARVHAALTDRGIAVATATQFESPIGEWLSRNRKSLSVIEKVLYFAADRASILRQLESRGVGVVLWDRYVLSALAYRLADTWRSGSDDSISEIEEFTSQVNRLFPTASLTVWLRLDPRVAESRARPGHDADLSLVDKAYVRIFDNLGSSWAEVDASDSVGEVARAVLNLVIAQSWSGLDRLED